MEIDVHDFQKIGMTTCDHKPAFSMEPFAIRGVVRCAVVIQIEYELFSQFGMEYPEYLSLVV